MLNIILRNLQMLSGLIKAVVVFPHCGLQGLKGLILLPLLLLQQPFFLLFRERIEDRSYILIPSLEQAKSSNGQVRVHQIFLGLKVFFLCLLKIRMCLYVLVCNMQSCPDTCHSNAYCRQRPRHKGI